MPTRREFLKQTAAAGVTVGTSVQIAQAAGDADTVAREQAKMNKAAHTSSTRIKSVVRREDTVLRYGGNGDNWHMSWSSDDRQYVSLCDGAGFSDPPKEFHNSRMLAISGGPRDAKFYDLPGYPTLSRPTQGKNDTRYYNFGTLALDGHLYQFLSTFNRSFQPDELEKPDLNNLVRFNGAKLIYSPDNGRSWHNQNGSTPVVWEPWDRRSRDTMVFFEEDQEAFSLLTLLQMGKNYEHNRDGYIYAYAPNGNTDGTMNELVMFRVPKGKLLDRENYEYFARTLPDGGAKWTRDINGRGVVHTFSRGWVNKLAHPYAWHPSVVYNAPLGLYMMANWGMGSGIGVDSFSGTTVADLWFTKPSYLGFWVAPNPWGPWTQIHEETAWLPAGDKSARAYQPQIAPKWIAADGKSFWLVWTDFQVTDKEAMKRLAVDDQQNTEATTYSETEVVRASTMMRKYMPYYAFNAQRVDLLVA